MRGAAHQRRDRLQVGGSRAPLRSRCQASTQPPSSGAAERQRAEPEADRRRAARSSRAPSQNASPESVEITGSRIPSTMKLSGLYSATVAAGSSIRSSGKKAEERKRITKTSGNRPWTTEALPVRSAIAAPMPAEGDRRERDEDDHQQRPEHPLLDRGAEDQPDREEPDRRERRPAPRSRRAGRARSRSARSAPRAGGR